MPSKYLLNWIDDFGRVLIIYYILFIYFWLGNIFTWFKIQKEQKDIAKNILPTQAPATQFPSL